MKPIAMKLMRVPLLLLMVIAVSHALDNISFEITPGNNGLGAVGKVEASCTVTLTCSAPWWFDGKPTATALGSPTVLVQGPEMSIPHPTKPGWYRKAVFTLVAKQTNDETALTLAGNLVQEGAGGGGPVPFDAGIIHADLDVDSDNNSTEAQRPPASGDDSSEDAVEEGVSSDPGVVVMRNRGWQETAPPAASATHVDINPAAATHDHTHEKIKVEDAHLVKARVEIKGLASDGTATLELKPSSAGLAIYTADGTPFTSGAYGNGTHWFLLEGITSGAGTVTLTLTPPSGRGKVTDIIKYTVVDLEFTGLGPPGTNRTDTWPAPRIRPGAAALKFPFVHNSNDDNIILVPIAKLVPALPAAIAQRVLGKEGVGGGLMLEASAIDDSHAAHERVTLKWSRPHGETTGALDFTKATDYDPSTGEIFSWVRYRRLPQDNSDFGDKRFRMNVFGAEYQLRGWQAFFRPLDNGHHDHPEATDNAKTSQNWYYYWAGQRQGTTAAVCAYSYDGANPAIQFMSRAGWNSGPGQGGQGGVPYGLAPFTTAEVFLLPPIMEHQQTPFNGAPSFNGGRPMQWVQNFDRTGAPINQARGSVKRWVTTLTASFTATNAPDVANLTWAHESTHYLARIAAGGNADQDQDRVPDAWEEAIGLSPRTARTLGNQFRGSGGGDTEFYGWLSSCLSAAAATRSFTATRIEQTRPYRDTTTGMAVPLAGGFNGQTAPSASQITDWTVNGFNWTKP